MKSVTSAVTSAVAVASRQIMTELRHDMEEVNEMREGDAGRGGVVPGAGPDSGV